MPGVKLLLLVVVAAQCVTASRLPRETLLDLDDAAASKEARIDALGDLKDIIFLVKNQIREIIEECLIQLLKFAKETLLRWKIQFLKKVKKWSLADVFDLVFDGAAELVTGQSADDGQSDSYVSPAQPLAVAPLRVNYGFYPYSRRQ